MTDEAVTQETTVEDMSETGSYEDLFLDDTEEGKTEETTEESPAEAEETTSEESDEAKTAEETTKAAETFDLKYLGQTTKLPKDGVEKVAAALGKNPDDVIALIQMGMNYNNTPEKKLLARFAEANGVTYEEYIKSLEDNAKNALTELAGRKIREAHPDWDDEKVAMRVELDKRARDENKAAKERAARFELDKPILEFIQKYPDVKEFPGEVKENINKGIHPIVAYESYVQKQEHEARMAELNTELARAKKDNENKEKTTGSLKATDDGETERDWFLEGLGKY